MLTSTKFLHHSPAQPADVVLEFNLAVPRPSER